MKTLQKRARRAATHPIGTVVSTMRRFASRVHYEAAVRAEYISRPPHQPLPADYQLGSSYSFHNRWLDTELLFLHLPGGGGPTGNSPRGMAIEYRYTGQMSLPDFKTYYDNRVEIPKRAEKPGNSPRGEKDKPDAYRAVYKTTGLINDYEGFITNPPYPAKAQGKQLGQFKWLLPAVLGLATGLAAGPLLRALRARPDE